MKRYVSYLYSTYNNQKIHNAGFARVELRTGRNRIDIHLRENGYAGKTGTVYLFTREQENIQGIPIGSIVFRGRLISVMSRRKKILDRHRGRLTKCMEL